MSKWLRGRLGRPIAGIMSLLMLVTILLPLAPPPAQAQEGITDWSVLEQMETSAPIPLIVLDFHNRSDYKSGIASREIADSLALAFEATGKYSVVDREQVESAMRQLNFTVPLGYDAQALLADRLNVPFIVTGEIENITRQKTKDGTYVEVIMNALVVSRITRLPINGARVLQKSSPKLGYMTSNLDPLVQEALSTGAYQIAKRIQDNRMPVATVLNPTRTDLVRIRGGSLIGMKEGMKLVAVRQESVSGILVVTNVTPIETTARIETDYRGIAPSDKVVPYFSLEPPGKDPKQLRERSAMALLPWLGAGLLFAFIGHTDNATSSPGVTATPLADAGPLGYPSGGNLLTWRKRGDQVLRYIIYRVRNGRHYPIAVVDGTQFHYVDVGYEPERLLTREGDDLIRTTYFRAYNTTYNVEIDENMQGPRGPLVTTNEVTHSEIVWTWELNFTTLIETREDDPTELEEWNVDIQGTSMNVECINWPLRPGQTCGYRVSPVFYSWFPVEGGGGGDGGQQSGIEYSLREGEMGDMSNIIRMTAVPEIVNPDLMQTTMSSAFACTAPQAARGVLQISGDPFFRADKTVTIATKPGMWLDAYNDPFPLAEASFPLEWLPGGTNQRPELAGATTLYVRMGVKYAENPAARALQLSSYASAEGYVFSEMRAFTLPSSFSLMRSGSPAQIGAPWPGKASQGRTEQNNQTRSTLQRSRVLKRH